MDRWTGRCLSFNDDGGPTTRPGGAVTGKAHGARPAEAPPVFSPDPRRPPRAWTFNLLVGRYDWLLVDLELAGNRVGLISVARVRWTDGDPVVLGSRTRVRGGSGRAVRRRRAIEAINELEREWAGDVGSDDGALRAAGFRLARKLLTPSFAGLLLHGRTDGPDIALALPGESLTVVLERMEDSRCRRESLIAQPRSRFGVHTFQLLRTHATRP
jgi:hypothetical protein